MGEAKPVISSVYGLKFSSSLSMPTYSSGISVGFRYSWGSSITKTYFLCLFLVAEKRERVIKRN